MGEFIKHGPCSNCGSSDGCALYMDGGSWCFVCHTLKRGRIFRDESKKETRSLPSDISKSYSAEAQAWAAKYGITIEDLIRNEVYCSEYQRRLFFCWKDDEGKLLGWQSRNFQEGWPKYTSSGDLETILPIYKRGISDRILELTQPLNSNNTICLTEDCLSAIKVALAGEALKASEIDAIGIRYDAMPCLTSSLSTTKLKRLAGLYDAFTVWLDGDMFPNAQKMVRQLQLMGREARAIWTPEDPKCYTEGDICNILLTGKVV